MQRLNCTLVGNPNAGKSTLFNALTGGNQRVGNWPGVTVERLEGVCLLKDKSLEIVDLPGLYALLEEGESLALDEQIASDYLKNHSAHLILNVVDATHLERSLYLTLQLLLQKCPVIVVLNRMDLAEKQGIEIDALALSKRLGCPVIPLSARTKKGLDHLKKALLTIEPNASHLTSSFEFEKDSTHPDADILVAEARYQCIREMLQTCVNKKSPDQTKTKGIDRIVLNRYLGVPIFLAVMYALFFFTLNIGGIFQDFFDRGSEALFVKGVASILQGVHAPAALIAILANGVGKGIQTTVTFLPVLGVLFFLLALLEESGYMARAAFIVDRFMGAIGLPGKALVPVIVGFGCNVPAILATRTLESKRDRLLTILMTPFVPCGARLAIFTVFVAAFFPTHGAPVVFSLYLIGVGVAMFTGWLLRRAFLAGERAPLMMELPLWLAPDFRSLLRQTWRRLSLFLIRAGRLIVPISMALSVIDVSALGQWLTPLFAPIGIQADNWPAVVGLLTGVLAKEVVIGTLNALYHGSATVMVSHFQSPVNAFSYLLFVLLYFPCVSTLAVMAKEIGWRWASVSMVWSLLMAYFVAFLFYQSFHAPFLLFGGVFAFICLLMTFKWVRAERVR